MKTYVPVVALVTTTDGKCPDYHIEVMTLPRPPPPGREWIRSADRLPRMYQGVLGVVRLSVEGSRVVRLVYRTPAGRWRYPDSNHDSVEVTHWIDYPELPPDGA